MKKEEVIRELVLTHAELVRLKEDLAEAKRKLGAFKKIVQDSWQFDEELLDSRGLEDLLIAEIGYATLGLVGNAGSSNGPGGEE